MPAIAKVGAWIEGGGSAAASEAYESSDSGSSSSSSEAAPESLVNGRTQGRRVESEHDDGEDEDEDQAVDWEKLLSRLRPAIMDKSKKRRGAFISKCLKVTDRCQCVGLQSHRWLMLVQLLQLLKSRRFSR